METVVALVNFTSEIPSVKLGAIMIRPFTTEEKNADWWSATHPHSFISVSELADSSFALAGRYIIRAGQPLNDGPQIQSEIQRAVLAARLLKAGDISAPAVLDRSCSDCLHAGSRIQNLSLSARHNSDWWFQKNQVYVLQRSDIKPLRHLLQALRQAEEDNRISALQVAIRRFHQTYVRDNADDRVIDLTIALESCLLSDVSDELKYRLALRGAALLAKNDNPHLTRARLEAMYDIRSEIVHNGKSVGDDTIKKRLRKLDPSLSAEKFPELCEDIVRSVLRAYVQHLANGKTLNQVNDELDGRIIDGVK